MLLRCAWGLIHGGRVNLPTTETVSRGGLKYIYGVPFRLDTGLLFAPLETQGAGGQNGSQNLPRTWWGCEWCDKFAMSQNAISFLVSIAT